MPFVSAPNIMEVEARCTLQGQQVENRWMFNQEATVTPATLEAIAIVVWNWWVAEYGPLLPDTVHLNEVVASDLTASDGPQFTYQPSALVDGSYTGGALPNEVSLCIKLNSVARGRSARGRSYIIAVPKTIMADDNHVTDVYGDAMVSAFQQLINDASTVAPLTIVSYRHDNAPRVGGPVYYEVVSSALTDTLVDSMKRRKPGVGA